MAMVEKVVVRSDMCRVDGTVTILAVLSSRSNDNHLEVAAAIVARDALSALPG